MKHLKRFNRVWWSEHLKQLQHLEVWGVCVGKDKVPELFRALKASKACTGLEAFERIGVFETVVPSAAFETFDAFRKSLAFDCAARPCKIGTSEALEKFEALEVLKI